MKIDIVVSMMALRNTRIKSVGKLKAMQKQTGYNAELQNGESEDNKKLKIKWLKIFLEAFYRGVTPFGQG